MQQKLENIVLALTQVSSTQAVMDDNNSNHACRGNTPVVMQITQGNRVC